MSEHVGWSEYKNNGNGKRTALDNGQQLFRYPARDSVGSRTVGDDSCFDSDMSDDLVTRESTPTLYFGCGSNMWLDQMNRRCPENKYIGIAVLHDWWA